MEIHGKLVDIHKRKIFPATVTVEKGVITAIERNSHRGELFILPGFVDAHIHIESSLLPPSEFARLAVRHGTVATVSDPHEIGNICGISGVEWMLDNALEVPFKFSFAAPSSLPAKEVQELLIRPDVALLGQIDKGWKVLEKDPELMEKIAYAQRVRKPIDGYAPRLFGEDVKGYLAAGITTDSSCTTLSEAREKRTLGLKILVVEGSASKNFETLLPLLGQDPEGCMLCSDHLHAKDLLRGHMNLIIKRALEKGFDLFEILRIATKNPIEHYKLDVGMLRVGDPADLILVEDLTSLRVLETYIDGACVFKEETLMPKIEVTKINRFNARMTKPEDFAIQPQEGELNVIELADNQMLTKCSSFIPKIEGGLVTTDVARDLLKIALVNRYNKAPPVVGFLHGFGLKRGAIATTISHDEHHILAVGTTDEDLASAINVLIAEKGGIALAHQGKIDLLPLPIAGLMSALEAQEVATHYENLQEGAKALGCPLKAPFMTLSFLTHQSLPSLRMSPEGLYDVRSTSNISLFHP
jgi:adenine deaminase